MLSYAAVVFHQDEYSGLDEEVIVEIAIETGDLENTPKDIDGDGLSPEDNGSGSSSSSSESDSSSSSSSSSPSDKLHKFEGKVKTFFHKACAWFHSLTFLERVGVVAGVTIALGLLFWATFRLCCAITTVKRSDRYAANVQWHYQSLPTEEKKL